MRRLFHPFMAFRFAVLLDGAKEALSLAKVINDPFTDEIWIARAHVPDQPPLGERLLNKTGLTVYMLPSRYGKARAISVSFRDFDWKPLSLDAAEDEVALDWVRLKGCTLSKATDSSIEELAPYLHPLLGLEHLKVSDVT